MAKKAQANTNAATIDDGRFIQKVTLGASNTPNDNIGVFEVSSYTINQVYREWVEASESMSAEEEDQMIPFPGNIAPEGYFYSPFHEVMLKELEDDVRYVRTRRINFTGEDVSVVPSGGTFFYPENGTSAYKDVKVIKIRCYMPYGFTLGQPFCIYDVLDDVTYRGFLSDFSASEDGTHVDIEITTDVTDIDQEDFSDTAGSRYIISILDDNAPEYAEYLPTTDRLVWRQPKKMSDLTSESPIYDMPFTNGRLYIHKNVNMFVRRQDPENGYKLMIPSFSNPLRRYRVEGSPGIDFDQIKYITDTMIDAC